MIELFIFLITHVLIFKKYVVIVCVHARTCMHVYTHVKDREGPLFLSAYCLKTSKLMVLARLAGQ